MQKLAGLPDKKMFRVDEAAIFFCRSRKTIYRWCREGKLNYVRLRSDGNSGGLLIPREAMAEVIRLSSECYK